MKELVFLVEGQAEKDLLDALLPRMLPGSMRHRVIPFEGKQDLEKQMGRRIRAYQNPAARFIILRDQDSHADCKALKADLLARCEGTGRESHCLVRVACKEMETFYLADLAAVERALAMPGLANQQGNRKFRRPDALGSPSRELKTLTKQTYEKRVGSRLIGRQLDLDNERSPSFKHLIAGIRRLRTELDVEFR